MRYPIVTVSSPAAHERASCLFYRSREQIFVHVNVRTIFVHVMFPSRIVCSPIGSAAVEARIYARHFAAARGPRPVNSDISTGYCC